MQTLRLEQTYPGDSLKVMWRDSGRAARDQSQGSPRTPCPKAAPSLSFTPLAGSEHRWAAQCSQVPEGFLDTEVNKEGAGSKALCGQQRATTLWR